MGTKSELPSNASAATVSATAGLEEAVREMATVMRRHRLSYEQTIYVTGQARKRLGVKPQKSGRKLLPRNLTDRELADFFAAVEKGGNARHILLFQLMYATGARVSEITQAKCSQVDLEGGRLTIGEGKGGKDRVTLFPVQLREAVRQYLAATEGNLYLFETARKTPLSPRWVQMLAAKYGEAAGIERMTPHRLRHTVLTHLTRAGLTDSQIALVSGHASKKSLAVYQHLALRDVEEPYQNVMDRILLSSRRC